MFRLSIVIVFFLLSLLSVCKAPAYPLWIASIIVQEFAWIFLCITGLLIAWGIAPQRFQVSGNILAFISFLLFLSPLVRAYIVGNHLKDDLQRNFGIDDTSLNDSNHPFRLLNMMSGITAKKVAYDSMVYAKKDSITLSLDFYPSQHEGIKPCVIVVHGGSWAGGDNKQLPELNSRLANSGYHVASMNYRLAPTYKNPAPVDDIQSALSFLRSRSNELHIDTTNFILLGRSAGAQIAMLAAYTLDDPSIKGVIDFYGPADMVWGYSVPSNPLIMNSRKVMEDYLGGTYQQVPANYFNSSPVNYVTKETVPTLLIHGQNDVLVAYEHSIRLNKKLNEQGVAHYLLTLPWATHGCDYTLNGPSGQLSTYAIEYFLQRVVNNATTKQEPESMSYVTTFQFDKPDRIEVEYFEKMSDQRDDIPASKKYTLTDTQVTNVMRLTGSLADKGDMMIKMGDVPILNVVLIYPDTKLHFTFYGSRIKTPDTSFYSTAPEEEKELYAYLSSLLK